jgi:quercetin dioxygenase-like cupin family protein
MSAHDVTGRAAPGATWVEDRPGDGIARQMMWGERLMVCRLTIAPFTVTPVHAHVHEQMTVVERGRARFVVDGAERLVGPGDVLRFPSGCEHGATMLDEEVVLIDIFSPIRDDFVRKWTETAGRLQAERAVDD